jgi:two-component system nitrate/nitrite response regulator NarL
VLIADDHPLYRGALAKAVRRGPQLELVAECQNGSEALEEIRRLQPDVAVLDLNMPAPDGEAVTRSVARDELPTRVLILSGYGERDRVYRTLAAGAAGYLLKTTDSETLGKAIRTAGEGGIVLSPDVQEGLVQELQQQERARPRLTLTQREREVLTLTAAGESAREIGERLGMEPTTVKTHLGSIYEKLGVSDRAAAVARAMREGLVD